MLPSQYRNNELYIENVALAAIATDIGTPTYVYSRAALESAYVAYRDAFLQYRPQSGRNTGNTDRICYAVKANSNLAVLNILARLGSGFDIVSVGELERVLMAGGAANNIVFSGVAKMRHEIERALEVGIRCFNVESASELDRIATVAEAMGVVAPISIRVNPDVDAGSHPYISTGLHENKFGIDITQAKAIYLSAAHNPALKVTGIDCHIGSQLTELSPFKDALQRVLLLVDELAKLGIVLEHIDVGGGLGVCYRDEQPPSAEAYIEQLSLLMQGRPQSLIIEPGRSIAANAGVLISRVDTLKNNAGKNFAVIDAAMNDMIRPALYDAWLDIIPLRKSETEPALSYDIVGPVCETGDFLGKDRKLALAEQDYLCIMSAGAYGFVMSSNYNTRGRAAEVVVDRDKYHIVRQRETIADLLRGESMLE